MPTTRILAIVAIVLGSITMSPKAEAQNSKTPLVGSPLVWSIDSILEWYVSHVTQYYDLNETQEAYTRELLTKRVKIFLKDYESDVRSLAAEMIDYQFKRQLPPPEIAQDWAERGMPLFKAIQEEIISGNMTWRNVLNDEQKSKHDRDMQLMKQQFSKYEKRLDRWKKGDVWPSDFGQRAISNKPIDRRKSEDAWVHYVLRIIRIYKLDAGQVEQARSILRDLQRRAAEYRNAHKQEFAQLKAKEKSLTDASPTADPKEIKAKNEAFKKLNIQLRKLEHPISYDMFNELKAKLDKIPTTEQRRVRDALEAKLKARYMKKPAATQPAATTQPATTTEPAS